MGRRTEVRDDLYSVEGLLRLARTQKNNRASPRLLRIAHALWGNDDQQGGASRWHGAAGAWRRHQALQCGRSGGSILDVAAVAWNRMTKEPGRLASLCSYPWIMSCVSS